jgi:hypothetical protein
MSTMISENEELARWVGVEADRALRERRLRVRDAATAVRVVAHLLGHFGDALSAPVSDEADQLERLVVDVATQVGDSSASLAVDQALRGGPKLSDALQALKRAVGNRVLVLDGRRIGAFGEGDLASAFAEQTGAVKAWLEGLPHLVVVTISPSAEPLGAPPLAFSNGQGVDGSDLWKRCGARLEPFGLALARRALLGDEGTVEEDPAQEDAVRADIVGALPPSWHRAHATLAVHARPLPTELAKDLEVDAALESLSNLGLCHRQGDRWRLEETWTRHWRAALPPVRRAAIRTRLAEAFARQTRPAEPDAWREGLSMIEAHRHFSRLEQWRRALEYSRYGASVLVEVARRRSITGKYALAAEMYDSIVSALEAGRVPGPRRLLGYARHYCHFNRALAKIESLDNTVLGYRSSIGDWPENALFWSRLARGEFYRERQADALRALDEARSKVPDHPEKATVLTARTARGLLEHKRVAEAVLVWGSYEPDTAPAAEIERLLDSATSVGWHATHLLVGDSSVHFNRELRVCIERFPRGFRAGIPEIEVHGEIRASRDGALLSLIDQLRSEVTRMVGAFTHRLEDLERARKQKLLSAVDIVASALLSGREVAWVFGELHRDETDQIWLETRGNTHRAYAVPDDVVETPLGEHLWFAEVTCSPPGIPVGPVRRLEKIIGTKDVWGAWAARMHDAEE